MSDLRLTAAEAEAPVERANMILAWALHEETITMYAEAGEV